MNAIARHAELARRRAELLRPVETPDPGSTRHSLDELLIPRTGEIMVCAGHAPHLPDAGKR